MTSPDMQSPVGALAPNVINTLQEIIASPIGAEAEEVLAALAQFGDSLVARFFRGYTSVTDIFAHAFDELGAELGGIPGMSGVTAWVSSIEELIGTAMNLIEEVFNGVTGIVDGLSFAVTGQGVEGNIAEGMHQVVEGLTLFLKLANMAMDLIQELIDGVLGVAGGTMSQLVQVLSWVIGVANQFLLFFHSIYDVFAALLGFAPGGDRPLSALTDALPNLLTAFSPLNAAKLFGQIPNALITAVWDAISGLLPKGLFDTFLGGLKGSANTGAGGSTGFPTFDDALNAIGGLFGKADTAQTTAVAVQDDLGTTIAGIWDGWFGSGGSGAVPQAQQTIEAIRTAVLNGYTVDTITSSQNWNKPTSTITELVVVGVGSGKNGTVGTAVIPLGGGFLTKAYDPAAVPSSVPVVIGTNGNPTKFGSDFETTPGAGGIATQFGYSDTSSLPGNGGLGGIPNGSNFSPGTAGQSTPLAVGGAAGTTNSASGQAGAAVSAGVQTKCGGSGGGGGASGRESLGAQRGGNGGNGGFPGGAGGNAGQKGGAWEPDGTPGTGAPGVLWVFYR